VFKSTDETLPPKQKPNWRPSGLLAAASNTVSTSAGAIVLKYHEPSEARKPPASKPWRLYVFKGDEIVDELELHLQSCWLFGREVSVCDYALEHPSCSKQHAVIQFRYMEKRNEFGDKIGKVKPYVIDLESANGTTVNDDKVPEGRYVELRDKDVVKFGHSTREYVVQLPPG
jgi:smad nuclear-interacting protein 1